MVEGLDESPDEDDEAPSDDDDEEEDSDEDSDDAAEEVDDEPSFEPSPEDDFDARVALELPRSFFAQPEPLKWIVGGANSLRIVPSRPHDRQKFGPGSLIPWRMSARWSQAVQTYS